MRTDELSAQVPISESEVVGIVKRWAEAEGALRRDEIGIGDDAAVLRFGDSHVVLTSDAMVEGVHFMSEAMSWRDVGWKCVVSNQSDIAAMGAMPAHALLTLAIPLTISRSDLDGLLSGVVNALEQYGGKLVGGDTVTSSVATISVAMTGKPVDSAKPFRRSAAEGGQLVAVTGHLGASAAGLSILKEYPDASRGSNGTAQRARVIDAHTRPRPRTDLVSAMVSAGVRCAMDVSDGLLIDLERICVSSDVDAVVFADSVPVDPDACELYPERALDFALTGGEDYELLYVADAETIASVNAAQSLPDEFGVIGEIKTRENARAEVTVLGSDGSKIEYDRKGWDHFEKSRRDAFK